MKKLVLTSVATLLKAPKGEPITLTLEAPPKVTGKLLAAYCIYPDGTKRQWPKPTET